MADRQKIRNINLAGGVKIAGLNVSRFREYSLQRIKSMQAGATEEEVIKQQQRITTVADMMRKIQGTRQRGRDTQLVGQSTAGR